MSKNWNHMPNEIKWMIIDNMDLLTRTRLKLCSKFDKCVVEALKFKCQRVEVYHRINKFDSHFSIRSNNLQAPGLNIKSSSNNVIITGDNYEREIAFNDKESARKFVEDAFINIMLNANVRTNKFSSDMKFPEEFENLKIYAKKAQFISETGEEVMKWLGKVVPGVEKIRAFTDSTDDEKRKLRGFATVPAIINAKHVTFCNECDVNDEQLLNLKCTNLDIFILDKITEHGINQLIKKWIKEDYPVGSNLKSHKEFNNLPQILEGLKYEVVRELEGGIEVRIEMKNKKVLVFKYGSTYFMWPHGFQMCIE